MPNNQHTTMRITPNETCNNKCACIAVQAVARELATAQGKLNAAGGKLRQIASQAEHDSEELRQARILIAQLQAQQKSQAERDSQLEVAQDDLSHAKLELQRAQHELGTLQSQLAASQQAAQRARVCDLHLVAARVCIAC